MSRIGFLDGHRGLAIMLVLLYHAFTRWAAVVPYGGQFANFPFFKYGWLGVNLFFLISGFVILMTLESCSSAKTFLARRWLWLFPAMLICSLIIYGTSGFFPERPAGEPTPLSLLPGLTFIEPAWWSALTGYRVLPLEDAFWSLFVEFKFYVFAAVVYYWRGRNVLFVALLSAFALNLLSAAARSQGSGLVSVAVNDLSNALSFDNFGWFASGAAFYVFHKTRERRWLWFGLGVALVSPLGFHQQTVPRFLAAAAMSLLFAATLVYPSLRIPLNARLFQFLGLVSYPLYLMHENLMTAMVIKAGREAAFIPRWALPFMAIAGLVALAYLIVRHAEPRVRAVLSQAFTRRVAAAQA